MHKFLNMLFSRRALAIAGVILLALLVWFAGPLVSFDTLHPLDSVGSRVVTIALLLMLLLLWLVNWSMSIIGVSILCLVIGFISPLLAFGEVRPFAPLWIRLTLISLILLAEEITRGLLTVDEDEHHSLVVFRGDAMFVAGQKTVNDTLRPVINKVAQEIAHVGGAVTVTGHTDSQPIHSAQFPSNQVLSEKRAAEVAALLQSGGVPAGRITVTGKGDTMPVADNRSKTGRAQNRRVEILVVE